MSLTLESLLAASTASPTRQHSRFRFLALALDLLVIVATTALAGYSRSVLDVLPGTTHDLTDNVLASAGFIVTAWLVGLAVGGAYRPALFGAGTEEYRTVLNGSLATAALVGIGCYLTQFPLSRGFYVLLFVIGIPALLVSRFLLRRLLQRARSRGWLVRRVIIAGTPEHIDEVAGVLCRETWLGYSVVGCLTRGEGLTETPRGIPVLGPADAAPYLVGEHAADVLFFAGGAFDSAAQARRAAWELEHHTGLEIIVAPSLTDVSSERVRVRPVAGLPLVHLEPPRARAAAHWAKRAFDIVVAAMLLVALSPLALVLIAWIKAHDGGPTHFKQLRVGRDGRTFWCVKFRSMVVDAEARLAELTADQDGHVLFKAKHDPRITPPGRLIRRFSLDELPQLWNVLRGEMSLVGPRPPLPVEVEQYADDMRRRLRVRPGMTGLWQVSGRSDLSWDDTVRLDLYYVDNWSMVQDLTILLRTFGAVVGSRGAY